MLANNFNQNMMEKYGVFEGFSSTNVDSCDETAFVTRSELDSCVTRRQI